jgi:hypothetical protein
MKKSILSLVALLIFTYSASAQNTLTKEEKKRIKSELKGYMKDPEIYQQTMQKYSQIIDSSRIALATKDAALKKLAETNSDQLKKIQELKTALVSCESKPVPHCPECAVASLSPGEGVSYKVQVGVTKKYDGKIFDQPRCMTVEKVDSSYHYAFSYFDSKDQATNFASELKRLGMHNAIVIKYVNGERAYATGKKDQQETKDKNPIKTKSTKKKVKKKK